MPRKKIPYFVKVRGCINCDAHDRFREKHGKDYGVDHEPMALCVLRGCIGYGHSLASPFIDPDDPTLQRVATEDSKKQERLAQYRQTVNKNFGWAYERIGVDLI